VRFLPDFVCCAVKSSKGRDQGGASSRLSSFLFPPLRSSPPGLFPLSSRLASPPGRRFPSRRSSRLTSPNTSTPRRRFPSLTQPTIVSTSVSSTRRGECSFEVYFFSNVPIQFHRLFRNAVSLGTKHVFPGEPSSWPRHNHARATPGEALANFTRLFSSAPHVAARGTARSALQATSRRRRRERDVSHARVACFSPGSSRRTWRGLRRCSEARHRRVTRRGKVLVPMMRRQPSRDGGTGLGLCSTA
jgi:hypothetical protein